MITEEGKERGGESFEEEKTVFIVSRLFIKDDYFVGGGCLYCEGIGIGVFFFFFKRGNDTE